MAELAGLEPEADGASLDALRAGIAVTDGWRKTLVEEGIADLTAIMMPGIAALLAMQAGQRPNRAAANALWQEFIQARAALLALAAPAGSGSSERT